MNALYGQTGVGTKPVVIGEHGVNMAAGAGRAATLTAQYTLYGGTRVLGGNVWAMTDQDTVTSNQWGIYDASMVIRNDVATVIQAQTTVNKPFYFPHKRRH